MFCFTSLCKSCSFSIPIFGIFLQILQLLRKSIWTFFFSVRFVYSSANSESYSFFYAKRYEALLRLCLRTAIKCFLSFFNRIHFSFETRYLLIFGILFRITSVAKLSFDSVFEITFSFYVRHRKYLIRRSRNANKEKEWLWVMQDLYPRVMTTGQYRVAAPSDSGGSVASAKRT